MQQEIIDTTAQAAVPQDGGLALFDLKVTATPLVITFDVDVLNAAVDAVLKPYEGRVVGEGELAGIKSEMSALNKVKDKLEAARKDIAGQISAPVREFEAQVKGAVQRIIDGRGKLDAQVKAFEQKQRESRRAKVQAIIDEVLEPAKLDGLAIDIDERWLNKSAKDKDIRAEVENIALREKTRLMEAEQLERARQDRILLIEQAVESAGKRYGFDLPVAKFSRLFSLEWDTNNALAQVDEWFAAEAERRKPVDPAPTVEAEPVEQPIQQEAPQPATQPEHKADITRVLNVRVSYSASRHNDVMRAIDALREIGIVTFSHA
ncbi:DUF1351 domain-containing protein [uncultured Desulfovibrio sp.]|uniref:DUF1351 domain-containing protein n=1 Tax=uncultured Desulfovibrio sp. TaxID=167968 RepID=UPI00262FA2DC|nr:DUF1351 domain-containing protein [uncultured Desulfovibrio sp.]